MHYNEILFPSPGIFDPERWLCEDKLVLKAREMSWSPFSRGSRACIGINVALAEIYIALAFIMRRFEAREIIDKELRTKDTFTVTVQTLRCVLEETQN